MKKCPHCGQVMPLPAADSDRWFDEFWSFYPRGRRAGKADARKVFKEIVTGKRRDLKASPEQVIAGVMRYAAGIGEGSPFVVMPARWLREGRWQDDDVDYGRLPQERRDGVRAAFDELIAELRGE